MHEISMSRGIPPKAWERRYGNAEGQPGFNVSWVTLPIGTGDRVRRRHKQSSLMNANRYRGNRSTIAGPFQDHAQDPKPCRDRKA